MQKCRFSWTSPGGKCALHWFYCLEKQKLCLERMPPGKKCGFAYVIPKKRNRNQQTKIGGKRKATWTSKKIKGLKSHLCDQWTRPFKFNPFWHNIYVYVVPAIIEIEITSALYNMIIIHNKQRFSSYRLLSKNATSCRMIELNSWKKN